MSLFRISVLFVDESCVEQALIYVGGLRIIQCCVEYGFVRIVLSACLEVHAECIVWDAVLCPPI